jgi:hypothetical protein
MEQLDSNDFGRYFFVFFLTMQVPHVFDQIEKGRLDFEDLTRVVFGVDHE